MMDNIKILKALQDVQYPLNTGVPYKGVLAMGSDGTNTFPLAVDGDGKLAVNLEVSDLQIGTVELKDADNNNRANINEANSAKTAGTFVLAVQHVDETGEVLSAMNVNTNPGFVKITDGTTEAGIIPTIESVKTDLSSVAGTVTNVNGGIRDAGTQTITLADDDPAVTSLVDGSQKSQIVDGVGAVIGSTANALDINIASGVTVDVSSTDLDIRDLTSVSDSVSAVQSGTWDITNISGTISLPTGAATETTLSTVAGDTTSIDGKTPALGTAVMTASTPTTIATDDTQFGAVGAASDVDGNVHGQLRYIGESVDGLGGNVDTPTSTHKSPSDFDAAYTTSTTITLSLLPFTITDSSQITYIKYIPTGGTLANILVNGKNGVTITHAADVLTVDGAGTPFATGDVYEVGINFQDKGYDDSTNSIVTSELNTVYNRYTDVETLVTAQALTAAYADYGTEIDMRGYSRVGVWVIADVNDSQDVDLKVLGKHTLAGADEFEIDGLSVKRLWTGAGTDSKIYYEFEIGTIPYLQIQAFAGTVGATAGTLTISTTKYY